jgi:hypothetical protein
VHGRHFLDELEGCSAEGGDGDEAFADFGGDLGVMDSVGEDFYVDC